MVNLMLSRSAILSAAWKEYRLIRPLVFALGDESGKRCFLPKTFATALRKAWTDAKRDTAHQTAVDTARAFVAAQARVMAEKVAAMPAGERSLRVSQLRDELTLLDYAPFGVRTANRRMHLDAELTAFTA